ncbi:ankyrin repeats (3 copies) domain-containing protein [Ditylenchus destructor]|uniref:Ankyrin repeats (3 copies) domain-containing protein n=1 Tax=Ditylenchus destructor TaxID=166010 RepID=A0AAD4MJA7_9BILA|nr:ankyrin repeats (3 copies) domain-containing protein [Ditylenchus destructor]
MSACKEQHVDIIKYLLSKYLSLVKAKLGERSMYQELTASHFAVRGGNEYIVKLLLDAGAQQQKDAEGFIPLFNAASGGHDHLFPLLLDNVSVQEE